MLEAQMESVSLTVHGDPKGDERVERAKYNLRLDHPVIVQLTKKPRHTDAPLVVLGQVHLIKHNHTKSD